MPAPDFRSPCHSALALAAICIVPSWGACERPPGSHVGRPRGQLTTASAVASSRGLAPAHSGYHAPSTDSRKRPPTPREPVHLEDDAVTDNGSAHDRGVLLGVPTTEPSPAEPPQRQTWSDVPWKTIFGAVGVVLGTYILVQVVLISVQIITWVVIAGFFAIVLAPATRRVQARLGGRRNLATGIVVFSTLAAVFGPAQPVPAPGAHPAHQPSSPTCRARSTTLRPAGARSAAWSPGCTSASW